MSVATPSGSGSSVRIAKLTIHEEFGKQKIKFGVNVDRPFRWH
jgi:hypothetical protein